MDAGISCTACRPYPRSIMYFENRGQHPSLNTFYQIVTLLDISVDQFFYPDRQNSESDCRQHIDRLLNSMDEKELTVMEATAEDYKKPEKRRERKKRRCLRFSVGFPGYALTASRASVATLAIFASRRAAKTLVGEPPQTRLWDILSQSNLSASPFAIAPVPFCAGRP